MSGFEPIAVIGRGCMLPGCASPEELWNTVSTGKIHISAPPDSYWRVSREKIMNKNRPEKFGNACTDQGGYVSGFERNFETNGYLLEGDFIRQLDPLFQWSLYAAKQALQNAGYSDSRVRERTGVILGNLSYPSPAFSGLFEQYYMQELFPGSNRSQNGVHPINRFMSGMPPVIVKKALGLGGEAFALDAACASGLYAVKLACDKLSSGSENLMLAGGVNGADSLFLHVGFTALRAMSPTGRSRPFNKFADGLIPAEGAAFVVLKRLTDAVRDQDRIHGVIRGIGLSNDGRTGGFLLPSSSGQVRCMQEAFRMSGLRPADISFIECHATGTGNGDTIEMQSLSELFAGCRDIALGSLKANIGHSITASGVAGLIKVLECMQHDTLVPTPNAFPVLDEIRNPAFRVLESTEPWKQPQDRKTACVSSFGFGGNNAHLIVEQWTGGITRVKPKTVSPREDVAVVGIGVRTDTLRDAGEFAEFLLSNEVNEKSSIDSVDFTLNELAFPPNDLRQTLGQQLIVLEVVKDALKTVERVDPGSTGVFIGMGADAEVNRYGFRWRLEELLKERGLRKDREWLVQAESNIISDPDAAAVIGTMPNIPANRINNQYDFRGPGFTVSCEELSGDTALKLAVDAIRSRELKSAIVGAVDFSCENVHQFAVERVLGRPGKTQGADAAIVFVLKNYDDALKDGDAVLAIVEENRLSAPSVRIDNGTETGLLTPALGHSHAASGLLHIGAAILLAAQKCGPKQGTKRANPLLKISGPVQYEINNTSFTGAASKTHVRSDSKRTSPNFSLRKVPDIYLYAAATKRSLLKKIEQDIQGEDGACRLAFYALPEEKKPVLDKAVELLKRGAVLEGWNSEAFVFRESPMQGETAFMYTGAASAYAGMGRDLLLAYPNLTDGLQDRITDPGARISWIYEDNSRQGKSAFHQLCAASFLCQAHTELSRNIFGLNPQAVMGMSAGETNALFAFHVWRDMDKTLEDIELSGLYTTELGGEFRSVAEFWGQKSGTINWENWRVAAPVEQVKALLANEDKAYLTIINTDNDCVIGGDPEACSRIIRNVAGGKAAFIDHAIAIHCPAIKPFEETWRRLHTRTSYTAEGVRFYSNYFGGSYETTSENVAEALTGQAVQTIDFPGIVRKAWDDGVRIFIEHGPRNSLSVAVDEILKDRPHLAVPLDVQGKSSHVQALRAACELWCAGLPVHARNMSHGNLFSSLRLQEKQGPALSFPLRKPLIVFPGSREEERADHSDLHERFMEPAPVLAPVNAGEHRVFQTNNSGPGPDKEPSPGPERVAGLSRPFEDSGEEALQEQEGTPDPLRMLQTYHRNLASFHKEYLDTQSRMHGAGMAVLTKALESFLQSVRTADKDPGAQSLARLDLREQEGIAETDGKGDEHPGPCFERNDLEVLASGRISSVFGPLFEKQDSYDLQVRMPGLPLLLCDRVTGIAGEPGSMGKGTIWTETRVNEDSWYLHHGRMPAGIVIESGQADLLLISWLGVDFLNQGKRAYRLLGCELVYHGTLPEPGDILKYEIHVDGHASQGDVRLFFFHYDAWVNNELRISVRNGQAGFFTKQELQESGGVLWDPQTAGYTQEPVIRIPEQHTRKERFSNEEVLAYTRGEMTACFGNELIRTATHTRTPRSQEGYQNFIGAVTDFRIQGGPAKRGYLRAENDVNPDAWFFQGHFKNDPCMPGTLMAEACLQMMSFYMVGIGLTLWKDGWRFEPVQEERYIFRCRGQVTPDSHKMVYEIFIDEIIAEPYPLLYAHVLCTVDGTKAFLCERLGLKLVPDWPLTSMKRLVNEKNDFGPVAEVEGFSFGYASLIHSALGRPSLAFGDRLKCYDGRVRSPRLPGPPYHFMSRIRELHAEFGEPRGNPSILAEYDIPENAWYFTESGPDGMPYCVLMEIALQPCGWLATFTLTDEVRGKELIFRNLDGTAVQHREVTPKDGAIRTKTTLLSSAHTDDMIIEKFDVQCFIGEEPVFTMQTVFGFFPPEAMKNQKGLPVGKEELENFNRPGNLLLTLNSYPEKYFTASRARMLSHKLLMLDRVTGYWPEGGKAGRGFIKAEKEVKAEDWFFKAHFFQDPVQPGSLGIEAMIQLVKFFMLHNNRYEGMKNPRFEPIALRHETEWHYRGQVTPDKRLITVDLEVLEEGVDQKGRIVVAEARLWIDGLKIYHVPGIGVRLVDAG